jgi:TldD protein
MNFTFYRGLIVLAGICSVLWAGPAVEAGEPAAEDDVLLRALRDELDRSMKELVLEDLPRPYFIRYVVRDENALSITADYGGIVSSDQSRRRVLSTRVRVGSYELDNTNVGRGGWGAWLPLEDDYEALRQAIWLASDEDYKRAVETLTRKKAYLKTKQEDEERPDDFTRAEPVRAVEPLAEIVIDAQQWEANLKRLSACFKEHPEIQDSWVSLSGGALNRYIVNSEGTCLRSGDTGFTIDVYADLQASDGMLVADELTFLAERVDQLPSLDEMTAKIHEFCARLVAVSQANVLEHYTGPVLFSPAAAGVMFDAMLAEQLCARPIPLGQQAVAEENMEKKIGQRILPRTFNIHDDPTAKEFGTTALAGCYRHDDEGVPARNVTLVEGGILKTLVCARAPTKKVKGSTGHGRSGGFGQVAAAVGCLYITDTAALSEDKLKAELFQAAKDEGLEFAIRIDALEEGGFGSLGDPIRATRIYVADGREEPFRGAEFLPVEVRTLRRLLAGGDKPKVYNSGDYGGQSIIAPAVLFEELELTRIEKEFDKLPILKPPALRD